jgi:hypothetical protein
MRTLMRTRRAAAWTGTSWRSRRGGEWECLEGAMRGEGWKGSAVVREG